MLFPKADRILYEINPLVEVILQSGFPSDPAHRRGAAGCISRAREKSFPFLSSHAVRQPDGESSGQSEAADGRQHLDSRRQILHLCVLGSEMGPDTDQGGDVPFVPSLRALGGNARPTWRTARRVVASLWPGLFHPRLSAIPQRDSPFFSGTSGHTLVRVASALDQWFSRSGRNHEQRAIDPNPVRDPTS